MRLGPRVTETILLLEEYSSDAEPGLPNLVLGASLH